MTRGVTPASVRLSSQAAEFLVLARLLADGIEAHKTYGNYPGYDIVALNPSATKLCRIQVKSRRAANYDKRFDLAQPPDAEFIVLVALNLELLGGLPLPELKQPNFWIVPTQEAVSRMDARRSRGQLSVRDLDDYAEAWTLIRRYLEVA